MNVPHIFHYTLHSPKVHNNTKSCGLHVLLFFFHICIAAILSLYSGTVQTDTYTAYKNIFNGKI